VHNICYLSVSITIIGELKRDDDDSKRSESGNGATEAMFTSRLSNVEEAREKMNI
jgi:hypothetical protein